MHVEAALQTGQGIANDRFILLQLHIAIRHYDGSSDPFAAL